MEYQFNEEYKVWQRPDYNYRIPYSDGTAVEERIYQSVCKATDLSSLSDELDKEIFDWVSLCSLSKKRANLLRPFTDLFRGKKILEPGCGAGPITRFLAECGAIVHAVEPSMERARIAAERCRDLPDIKVFCDDLESFSGGTDYDGIIQVGVLEYATKYSKHPDEPLHFLARLKSFLKEDGFMITAIENQLGLKYFSGFAEDHNGELMHNINDNYRRGEANTWGRRELLSLFSAAGFSDNEVYLPFPDYKLPAMVVFPGFEQQQVLGKAELRSIFSNISYKDQQKKVPLFALDKTLPLVAANGLLGELANSFCVLSRLRPADKLPAGHDILLQQYTTERRREMCKSITFREEAGRCVIERSLLDPASGNGNSIVSFPEKEAMLPGQLYHYELVRIMNMESWSAEQVAEWLKTWINYLQEESGIRLTDGTRILFDKRLPARYLDAVPVNVLVHGGKASFIDLEFDNGSTQSLDYLMFRALHVSLTRISSIARPSDPQMANAENLLGKTFQLLGYAEPQESFNRFFEDDAALARAISTSEAQTTRGSVTSLLVRATSQELVRINDHQSDLNALRAEIVRLEELERGYQRHLSSSTQDLQELLKTQEREHREQLLKAGELMTGLLKQQEQDQREMDALRKQQELDLQHLLEARRELEAGNKQLSENRRELQKALDEQKRLDTHNKGLEHEVYSLSTSRIRMIKSFIRQSMPFISKKPRKSE